MLQLLAKCRINIVQPSMKSRPRSLTVDGSGLGASWQMGKSSFTTASAQMVTNTPSQRHFLIMKYFKVNDNDIYKAK